jgi:RNA polymerase sigma-70 factor (ECF subfamily)
MMDDSDAVAVAQAQAGDQDAFGLLVERHSIRLFQMVYRMTGNEQDAEDVVQETFLRAYKQLNRFESRAGFGTWLHRIAANCSLDFLRKRKRQDQHVDPVELEAEEPMSTLSSHAPPPDDQVFHLEVQQKIEAVMEQLTPMERTAFVLRHFEGRSIEEIGRALGTGPSATKQSIFRAVQKLRRSLEPVLNTTP